VILDPHALALALAGGMLIGVAAVALLALHGRVFGVSGIVNALVDQSVDRQPGDRDWRGALLAGVVLGALLWTLAVPAVAAPRTGFPAWALALGGLLVGFGTRLGSGCTSGHGICGLSRLSARSLVATVTFIATGMATLYLLRHAAALLP
jgi:hypothetical protein